MKMRKQRLIGFGLVLIAVLVTVMASMGGPSPEDQDATAAVLIGPPGPLDDAYQELCFI